MTRSVAVEAKTFGQVGLLGVFLGSGTLILGLRSLKLGLSVGMGASRVNLHRLWEAFGGSTVTIVVGVLVRRSIETMILTIMLIHLVQTFSKRDQAIDVIVGDLRMIVNQLADLWFETTTEETNGVSVIEMCSATTISFEEGDILANRPLLTQVTDLVKSVFSVIGVNKTLAEFSLEDLVGGEVLAIDNGFIDSA